MLGGQFPDWEYSQPTVSKVSGIQEFESRLTLATFLFLNVNFPHRHNADGTFDSICASCFVTVATEDNERDLLDWERNHVCSGLARYSILSRESKLPAAHRGGLTGNPDT